MEKIASKEDIYLAANKRVENWTATPKEDLLVTLWEQNRHQANTISEMAGVIKAANEKCAAHQANTIFQITEIMKVATEKCAKLAQNLHRVGDS